MDLNLDLNDPNVVACHEAAHLIVGEALGKRLDLVQVCMKAIPPGALNMSWAGVKPLDFAEREISISMAGQFMDRLMTGRNDENPFDHQKIQMILRLNNLDMEATLLICGARMATIISNNVEVITSIAKILLSERLYNRTELLTAMGTDNFSIV